MNKVCLVLVVALWACVALSAAQLTFTSSWGGGKRSGPAPAALAATLNCRNDDTMANLYRLIQNEAEKLLLCQQSQVR